MRCASQRSDPPRKVGAIAGRVLEPGKAVPPYWVVVKGTPSHLVGMGYAGREEAVGTWGGPDSRSAGIWGARA